MYRIVATVTSLEQHLRLLAHNPELYRPPVCPHCGVGKPWRHGCYRRKADRSPRSSAARNPVPVPRFRCRACEQTCSRLPAFMAPRRWYDWVVQQIVLLCLAGGDSLHGGQTPRCSRHAYPVHADRGASMRSKPVAA